MWGKRQPRNRQRKVRRNIPTRVGKTGTLSRVMSQSTEHPHACGENSATSCMNETIGGTSPRVWGKLVCRVCACRASRNIPTRVGKTLMLFRLRLVSSEHPHACGENSWPLLVSHSLSGTSPRVWGKQLNSLALHHCIRNIPTRVGKTQRSNHGAPMAPEHPHACGENHS